MTRVDKLKIVMLAISLTILTFLFLCRYLSAYCVSLFYTSTPTHLSALAMGEQRRTVFSVDVENNRRDGNVSDERDNSIPSIALYLHFRFQFDHLVNIALPSDTE